MRVIIVIICIIIIVTVRRPLRDGGWSCRGVAFSAFGRVFWVGAANS